MTLAMLVSLLIACSREPTFRGTTLDPPRSALDFTLRDQFGQVVRLSDLRGRVVVLTFLYTSCLDVCPLVARKLHHTSELIQEAAPQPAFLAVTVDPERDTEARAYEYSEQYGMLDRWHFLVGTHHALQPLWDYYWVGQVHKEVVDGGDDPLSLERAQAGTSPEEPEKFPYTVRHTAPVHLIDQEGKIRVVYGNTFRPAELAHDIDALLKR